MLGEEMRLGPASSSCKTRRRCRTGDEDLGWRVQIERADDESGHLTWPQLPVDATSQRHPVSGHPIRCVALGRQAAAMAPAPLWQLVITGRISGPEKA